MAPAQILVLAARYTLGGKGAYLSGFLSRLSMLGIVLAISLLVIVLSVMNGFDREMREHILGIVPQLTMKSYLPVADWQHTISILEQHAEVRGAAPFVQFEAMLSHDGNIDTSLVNGISLADEKRLGAIFRVLDDAAVANFAERSDGLLLGAELARKLGLAIGDQLTLIAPAANELGKGARFEYVVLSGVLVTGTELDHSAAFVHLPLAGRMAGIAGQVHGFRLGLDDLFAAPRVGWELLNNLPAGYYASDWTMTHGNLYAAIQLSRDLIGVLLLSIIAIAAFNVVSSLVLVIIDKQSDIAILRAMGATPRDIKRIFLLQGLIIALVGIVLGSTLGVAGSYWAGEFVLLVEAVFQVEFLTTDIYPISYIPSDVRARDVLIIALVTTAMCFLASLYPAHRAAKFLPAEVLRHE